MAATPVLTPAERDAMLRYRHGQSTGHVESLFVKLNLPDARALWLKLTLLKHSTGRGETVVEAWAIAFDLGGEEAGHVAVKQTWPYEEARIQDDCLFVKVGDVRWNQGHTEGTLTEPKSGDTIAWELDFDTAPEGFRHFPGEWMYKGPFPKTKAMSPQIDTRFTGRVTVNGHTTAIDGAPGMMGHNWGRQQGEFWSWAHCNVWSGIDEPGLLFEGLSGKVALGPVTTPLMTILHARIPGERLTFNGFVELFRTRSKPGELSWRFSGTSGDRRIEGSFSAPPERWVCVNYHDPDGRIVHCLNTKIADGQLAVCGKREGHWEQIFSAAADRSAALEIGTRAGTQGIPISIL